ncbi:hypothetical protein IH785_11660 [candidate division KSB1 bacterium]|nr:hypothetical protein [candidate division KSB1 bacterium]
MAHRTGPPNDPPWCKWTSGDGGGAGPCSQLLRPPGTFCVHPNDYFLIAVSFAVIFVDNLEWLGAISAGLFHSTNPDGPFTFICGMFPELSGNTSICGFGSHPVTLADCGPCSVGEWVIDCEQPGGLDIQP